MKVVGCIAEFNPFHKGHQIYLEKARELSQADAAIVVMSGDFVQRGEPALIDSDRRTQCALSYGADLVLELHPALAISSAEFFAAGAVQTLIATGITTDLAFGSESGRIQDFAEILALLEPASSDRESEIQSLMQKGISYSAAMAELLQRRVQHTNPDFHFDPNNILGLEYMKAASRLDPSIRLHTYRRMGAGYHQETLTGTLESASAIRNHLRKGKPLTPHMVPEISQNEINGFFREFGRYACLERYFPMLQYQISLSTPSQLAEIHGGDEGLENLLLKKVRHVDSYHALVSAMTSRRYPASRIRRYLLAILLHYTKETAATFRKNGPSYLKPLGFNKKGQSLLRQMKDQAALPILSNLAGAWNQDPPLYGLDLDLRASDIYRIGMGKPTKLGSGVRRAPKKG